MRALSVQESEVFLVWEHHANRLSPWHLFRIFKHFGHVIVIDDSDVTNAFLDGFNLRPIIALRLAGEVGL